MYPVQTQPLGYATWLFVCGCFYELPRPLVHRPTRDGSEHCHFRVPKQASGAAHGAGDGRSRVDIGRCEAQGGAPRPPPQPTGPRGPLGPCTARLVPCRRPQHPRLDPRQRPRLVALMEAWGVRERPWWVLSGVGPTQTQKASPPAPPGVCRAMGCPLVAWKWPRAARVTSMSRLGVPRVLKRA